jgi:hypothetical protein
MYRSENPPLFFVKVVVFRDAVWAKNEKGLGKGVNLMEKKPGYRVFQIDPDAPDQVDAAVKAVFAAVQEMLKSRSAETLAEWMGPKLRAPKQIKIKF